MFCARDDLRVWFPSGLGALGSGWRCAFVAVLVIGSLAWVGVSGVEAGQSQQAAQDGFVPMGDIPPEEQLPAAPLLMTAYAAVWAIAVGYLWTLWRRLGSVEKELADVSRRLARKETLDN